MKPTKMRNNQMYRAAHHTKSKQLGSNLTKDLQKKYGKRSTRIIKGDTVKVVRGEYKDIDGKVMKISTRTNRIAIEGIKKEKGKGDKVDVFIHTSNVTITSLNASDQWRMRKLEGKDHKSITKDTKKEKVQALDKVEEKPDNKELDNKVDNKEPDNKVDNKEPDNKVDNKESDNKVDNKESDNKEPDNKVDNKEEYNKIKDDEMENEK